IQATSFEILAGLGAFRPLQAILKKNTCGFLDFQQRSAMLGIASLFWAAVGDLGQRYTHLLRDQPDRFRESYVLDLLYKAEDISRGSAAEAVNFPKQRLIPEGNWCETRWLWTARPGCVRIYGPPDHVRHLLQARW